MLDSIRVLSLNTNYMILTQAYAIYFGLYLFYLTCLNDMVADLVEEKDIGWMGFAADIFALVGIFVSSIIIAFFKAYQFMSLLLTFGAVVAWTCFTFALLHWKTTVSLYVCYSCVSLFGAPFFVVGIEYAAEVTYPVSESISSAIILMLGNLYGFLMVLFLGGWIEKGRLGVCAYVAAGFYAICFLLVCFVKQKLKRSEAEASHNTQLDQESDPLI